MKMWWMGNVVRKSGRSETRIKHWLENLKWRRYFGEQT